MLSPKNILLRDPSFAISVPDHWPSSLLFPFLACFCALSFLSLAFAVPRLPVSWSVIWLRYVFPLRILLHLLTHFHSPPQASPSARLCFIPHLVPPQALPSPLLSRSHCQPLSSSLAAPLYLTFLFPGCQWE